MTAVAGLLSLVPAALVTIAYYRHMWHYRWSEMVMPLLVMSLVYVIIMAGPMLMVGAAALGSRQPGRAEVCALAGSGVILTYSLMGLAAQPPDLPVRITLACMALAGSGVLAATLRLRASRRRGVA